MTSCYPGYNGLDMLQRARPLLGTVVEIRAWGSEEAVLLKGVERAFVAVERVQRLMSFHDPLSDLSQINRHAFSRPLRVHHWTWRVLRTACWINRLSQGAFDCTIAPHLVAAGQLPAQSPLVPQPVPAASMQDVLLLPHQHVMTHQPLWLDLGGIAKGFAVDCAIDGLHSCGVRHAVVNAGGDIRVLGGEPVAIYSRDPAQPQRVQHMGELAAGAVATSAPYFSEAGDGSWSVREPVTGASPRRYQSVSVLAPTCIMADALTKVVWLRGEVNSRRLFQRFGVQVVVQ